MQTTIGHLTYCSNIHSGESWNDHFGKLQRHIPEIKQQVSPFGPFGIGLRLSNTASLELRKQAPLDEFRAWLNDNNCYVFTMNGFPYGGFHHTAVKDQVHAPDWLSADRVSYTIRLAQILSALLPDGVDGGISTSPLSYKHWHNAADENHVFSSATLNILQAAEQLVRIKLSTGKIIHLDIEPEPDGLLGDGKEFLQWYIEYLLPAGIPYMQEKFGYNDDEAASAIREHIQLCYDVCHFAVSYENHHHMVEQLRAFGIKTGKIQISAALRAQLGEPEKRTRILDAFRQFNEPVYLHQVVAQTSAGGLIRYADLPDALTDGNNPLVNEWRAHYHVPIFIPAYGLLQSTQSDIEKVLSIQQFDPFTFHLEIETYTWEVLPEEMRVPITDSIVREMRWVIDIIRHKIPD